MLEALPEPNPFWSFVSESCSALNPSTRKNHFFGAVQYAVLANPDELLASYFPASHTYEPTRLPVEAGPVFWTFLQRRRSEIVKAITTKEVSINKLGRLSVFAPVFLEIANRDPRPLAFIDVGCSVGLGLLWPHFRYSYPGHGCISGHPAAPELSCAIQGTPTLSLNGFLPDASFLCGIEIQPLSAHNPDDVRWLVALTAPGDTVGRARLELGLERVRQHQPRIEEGCVLDVLPRIERELPPGSAVVVFHAMTVHHLRGDDKLEAFQDLLRDLSNRRRVFEAGVEWPEAEPTHGSPVELMLTEWTPNGPKPERFGKTDQAADGSLLEFS
jgi:hypothetical protein